MDSYFSDFTAIFILITIFGKVHRPCKKHPNIVTILMISTITFCLILFFLTSWSYISFWFSGYNVLVTIFGNVHRPCRHHFIIINKSLHLVYSFFSCCMTSVAILGNADKPVNNGSTLSKLSYIMSILFLIIFALITILGNTCRPCK